MIENISSQTNISLLLLRNGRATGTETPRQWHSDRHNGKIVPIRPQSWQRVAANDLQRQQRKPKSGDRVALDPQARISDLIDPRQWLLTHNPLLASLVTAAIGDRWLTHVEDLQQLLPLAEDREFQSQWQAVKRANKQILADALYRERGISIDVDTLFDVQLQPIDGHQRQLLNILHIITLYRQIKQQPNIDVVPRTVIFGDVSEFKPQVVELEEFERVSLQQQTRSIVMLIESLAQILAADPAVRDKLRVVYVPQSAGLTTQMYRAAELTEHLATAGMEDVDLDRLKLAANGALSISSMSKANHLLQQAVGKDNCFCFGLSIPEIALFKEYGYDPYNYYKYYPEIRQAIDALMDGKFSIKQPEGIISAAAMPGTSTLVDLLLDPDEHMVLADYVFYRACQLHVSEIYRQKSLWTRMSILNVAALG